ncbi:Pre-mRNA-splicing factor ISY1 [Nakaseomyces glabratus]|nr:Isy1-like splicing family [Nakaseomyces glabratus]KTB14519.1 Pre-mRNA-splicing factor ISY1 [Nakaseomyces glabratus]KTB20353.1 Pre-mRNA-splicing factor ISY1 [Nakaseomyces glabratus]QNG16008.1 uncharacterized protein GWK60_L01177 [Nakaseomyces glabratus]SCV16175.1 Pre-mRNA-splicing factor ISY1 [Nakaseomyces glabratus]
MSRNVDKSQTVLALYQEHKAESRRDYNRYKRPRVESVRDPAEAREWYKQTLREVGECTNRLYDPLLSEEQVRECNARVNQLIQESQRWSRHLRRFKQRQRPPVYGGVVVNGVRYIGRARELPEARKRPTAARQFTVKRAKNVDFSNNGDFSDNGDYRGTSERLRKAHGIAQQESVLVEPPTQQQMEEYLVERRKRQLLHQLNL